MPIARPSVNADKYLDSDEFESKPLPTSKAPVFEDEDEDEAPKVGTSVQAGWAAGVERLKETTDEYTNDFKWSDEPTLVKFVGDGPFYIYYQHWIERQGKKSFVCLEDGCPLCDIAGDKPRSKFAFTVAVLDEDGPTVQILTAPPSLFRQLKAAHEDSRKGPLSKHYWALSRTGSGPKTSYILDMVRARDLAEEWDLDPASVEEAVADIEPLTPDVIRATPRQELLEIARSI